MKSRPPHRSCLSTQWQVCRCKAAAGGDVREETKFCGCTPKYSLLFLYKAYRDPHMPANKRRDPFLKGGRKSFEQLIGVTKRLCLSCGCEAVAVAFDSIVVAVACTERYWKSVCRLVCLFSKSWCWTCFFSCFSRFSAAALWSNTLHQHTCSVVRTSKSGRVHGSLIFRHLLWRWPPLVVEIEQIAGLVHQRVERGAVKGAKKRRTRQQLSRWIWLSRHRSREKSELQAYHDQLAEVEAESLASEYGRQTTRTIGSRCPSAPGSIARAHEPGSVWLFFWVLSCAEVVLGVSFDPRFQQGAAFHPLRCFLVLEEVVLVLEVFAQ